MPYVVLSCMVVAVIDRLATRRARRPGSSGFLAGAGFYAIGLIFFIRDDRRFNHAIWHLFVLAGSICHYRAVIVFVTSVPA